MNDVEIPALERFKRCFEHVSVSLTDVQKMWVICFALGDMQIKADSVREHLLGHLSSRISPAEICTALRAIRSKAPKEGA